jgi:serine/threonine protein kinase
MASIGDREARTGEYQDALVRMGFSTIQRSVWAHVGRADAEFGWKLHLSGTQATAIRVLDTIVPILRRHDVPFKVARDPEMLGMLNEGALGPTQVGKFVTIYPQQGAAAINALARELIEATRAFHGPKVQTDLHLGSIVYARYGSFSPAMRRNRLGTFTSVDEEGKGGYTVPFVPPEGIANPFEAYLEPRATQPRKVRPIGPGYLVTDVLYGHAKGSVLAAIDLRSQQSVRQVVLKEGRPHCLSDEHGRDMWYRLRNQARAHHELEHTGVVAVAGEPFEHAGSLFLPLDYVEGRDLGSRPALPFRALDAEEKRRLLAELVEVIGAIRRIHDAGYAHRDLSVRNIRITPEGRAILLDLELSHRIADTDTPPLFQGTPGFVSPQQLVDAPASLGDDLFAFGSVLICVVTGLDPQRVLHARGGRRAKQIEALSGAPAALCELAARCVDDDAAQRPSARAIEEALTEIAARPLASDTARATPVHEPLGPLVHEGLQWLVSGAMRDAQGMWVSPELSVEHASLKLVSNYRVYRSANRGVAGVLYTIAKLHRFGFVVRNAREHVEKAVDWLLDHADTPDDQMPGLHFGEAGVAVAIAQARAAGLIDVGPWLQPYLHEALSGPIDWPDLTHGAAGQGMAALICAQLLGQPDLVRLSDRCVTHLIDTQLANGSWQLPDGVDGMSGSVYTGFAHGVAGIVSFLATHARKTGSSRSRAAADRGGKWLLEVAHVRQHGPSLWWTLTPESQDSWTWWCHGAPGISLAFLSLHELTGHVTYSAAVRACMRAHDEEVRAPNMSQCHGLSGLGEVFLEAHRVLRDESMLRRARILGALLANLARRDETGASWLVENPYLATPDLMIGSAGIVHFLARLRSGVGGAFSMPLMPSE